MERRKPTTRQRVVSLAATFILAFVVSNLVCAFEFFIMKVSPAEALLAFVFSTSAILAFVTISAIIELVVTK